MDDVSGRRECPCAITRQKEVLAHVIAVATEAASERRSADDSDDVAQKVACKVLALIESGRMVEWPPHLDAVVKAMVRHYVIDAHRRERAITRRQMVHLRRLTKSAHVWMERRRSG
jgi:hypothetical protein